MVDRGAAEIGADYGANDHGHREGEFAVRVDRGHRIVAGIDVGAGELAGRIGRDEASQGRRVVAHAHLVERRGRVPLAADELGAEVVGSTAVGLVDGAIGGIGDGGGDGSAAIGDQHGAFELVGQEELRARRRHAAAVRARCEGGIARREARDQEAQHDQRGDRAEEGASGFEPVAPAPRAQHAGQAQGGEGNARAMAQQPRRHGQGGMGATQRLALERARVVQIIQQGLGRLRRGVALAGTGDRGERRHGAGNVERVLEGVVAQVDDLELFGDPIGFLRIADALLKHTSSAGVVGGISRLGVAVAGLLDLDQQAAGIIGVGRHQRAAGCRLEVAIGVVGEGGAGRSAGQPVLAVRVGHADAGLAADVAERIVGIALGSVRPRGAGEEAHVQVGGLVVVAVGLAR
ncbi:hypothetical protein D3C85_525210 [compost metagenome]